MIARYELEQMRMRLDRIEREVGGARLALESLERRAASETKAPPEPAAAAPVPDPGLEQAKIPVASVAPPPLPPASEPVAGSASDPVSEYAEAPRLPAPVVSPVAVPAPRLARNPPPPEPSPLRVWLERLQLWPPAAGEGSAEARLGAWWATRVGALLAVIGVVFFGIYVSLHTPPWVKFCELLAVSLGVSGLGLWLERRLPAFGGVVFAGGLALLFFTAYAGYVVPGVRVFDSLWGSVAWQGVAVALIVAVALWRRAPLIATLAVGLGHVTAIFSGRDGFDGFALGAAALLGVVAVALRRLRDWEGPSVVAMPAGYAVLFLGLQAAAGERAALPFAPWPFIAGMAALFFLRDWRRGPVEAAEVTAGERWFQNANASLAALAALVTALGWYRAQLGTVYLVAAGAFAAAAWGRSRQVRGGDGVAAVLTAKATGALTLGVIELAEARTVALALLVQAWVLAWTARRLGSRVLAAATGLTAAVATWFFFRHGLAAAPVFSIPAAQAVLFTAGLAALATEAGRWLVKEPGASLFAELLASAVAAAGAALVASRWTPAGWEPALTMAWALIFLGVAWARAGRAAAWAAAALAGLAQLWLWLAANPSRGEATTAFLFWNALAVLGPTLWAGAWMGARAEAGWRMGGQLAWALATVGLVFTAHGLLPPHLALVLVAVAACAAGWASAWAATRHLPWLATLALGLGWWQSLSHSSASLPAGWLGLAALVAWALPAGLRAFGFCDEVRRAEALPETMERLQVIIATALALRALIIWLDGAGLAAGLGVFAGGLFLLALRPGLRPALAASWAVWGLTAVAVLIAGRGASWLAFVAALAWVPAWLWVRVPAPWLEQFTGWRRHAPAVQCTLATLVGLVCAHASFAGAGEVFALAALVLVAALGAHSGRVKPAREAASVAAAFLAWSALSLILAGDAEGFGAGLAAVALASGTLAGLPLWLEVGKQPVARAAGGGVALVLLFVACAAQKGALAPYATVGWGLASITLFMSGLFWRKATYRVLGLIGLALCVPRIFVVDLHSMLHRIVAFIVIGVVMLWVGFSYHRFRHLVTDAPATPPPSS